MRLIFVGFLYLLLLNKPSAQAQGVTNCGFKIPPKSLIKTKFQSVYEAGGIVKGMLDSISWKENFRLQEQNGINNAYATIIRNTRWIIYDNDFLENLDTYTATKWASISVLAHEIGHHYFDHVVTGKGSTIPTEIEADGFSGYVLYKIGATLEQSIAAMQAIATDKASSTHPAKKDRVTAITRGWNQAKAASANAGNAGNNPGNPTGPGNNSNPSDPATDPSWIALGIMSPKNETVYLSDDGKNFQLVEIKVGQPFVFKFEIYNYGWLKLPYYNGFRTFKLMHGKDYSILWNRRTRNWTVTEIPQ